jgi:hypothetical protein
MSRLQFCLLLIACVAAPSSQAGAHAPSKPNVVLIFADDKCEQRID